MLGSMHASSIPTQLIVARELDDVVGMLISGRSRAIILVVSPRLRSAGTGGILWLLVVTAMCWWPGLRLRLDGVAVDALCRWHPQVC